MTAIYVLWLREMKRYFRAPAQIISGLGQPLLYLLALGFGLGPVFAESGRGNYIQFLAPGIIAMSLLFSGAFSGMGLMIDRQFGFLKETLVAPVPRGYIMVGRMLGRATVATLQALLVFVACLLAGFRPSSFAAAPAVLLLIALTAIVFCSMGAIIGSRLQSLQAFPMVVNLLMMPLFFLSGALYPLQGVPPVLHAIMSINPLTYGVDGLRTLLIDVAHYGLALDFGVLAAAAVIFIALGAYSFSKIEL